MHVLTGWFIRNPVAANLIMALILTAGAVSLWGIRIEGFPQLPPDTIELSVLHYGASAEQVDSSITRLLEQSLEGLPGVDKIFSLSMREQALIQVKKIDGYNLERLLEDIKLRVNSISSLPALAERPVIRRQEFNFPALIVQVYSDTDQYSNAAQHTLQKVARRVKEKLLAQPEISKINQWGERNYEVSIEVAPDVLQSYGLTLQELAARIQGNSLRYRTGTLKTDGGSIQLRADTLAEKQRDFAEIPVLERTDGTTVYLGDIASIDNSFEDDDVRVLYQGKPAIGFEVIIDNKGNLLKVSEVARSVVSEMQQQLSGSVHIGIWGDQSGFISERLNLLQTNGWQGLVLVFILLALFLSPKLAFWVALGVPISFAGTLALMGGSFFDYSLNDVTTFGMIIVLGILVDDAVVIGESVYAQRRVINDPIKGTEEGVRKVSVATIFGVLTTMAAFYPMTTINNPLGQVLASFAVVVMIALSFSLFESKFILPAHLAGISLKNGFEGKSGRMAVFTWWYRLQSYVDAALQRFNRSVYRPALRYCLFYRYQTLTLFLTIAVFVIGLVMVGVVRTTFFPSIPGSIINIKVEMDSRVPYELTLYNTDKVKNAADEINRRLMREHQLEEPPIAKIMAAVVGSASTEIYAELSPPDKRRGIATLDILQAWRSDVGQPEGVNKLQFSATEETGGGFELEIYCEDDAVMKQAVKAIKQQLAAIEGVADVRSDLAPDQPEIRLHIKPEGVALGLNTEQLAAQIGDAYGGLEVQRFQRGVDEVKTFLRMPKKNRSTLHDLLQNDIRLPSGDWVPLTSVAVLESHYVPEFMWRRNFRKVASISASINKNTTSSSAVYRVLKRQTINALETQYPGLNIKPAGELEEESKMKFGLVKALIMTLLLIYTLLAIPLKSYLQPLIIMSVVPFGFTGAVFGHLIMGIPFSLLSFFGILALTGVVVNDSLVMMTCYNDLRRSGMAVVEALVEAGSHRLRAIILTTVTTVAGLVPLLRETSEQAQYLIPAAVSLAFGELFATLITLILVPVLTSLVDQWTTSIAGAGKKIALEPQ